MRQITTAITGLPLVIWNSEHAPDGNSGALHLLYGYSVKPYYDKDGITIYHGNCFDVLPLISGVECVVTSPPYNQKIDQFKASGFKAGGEWADRIASSYSDSKPETEYQCEQALLLAKLLTVTTNTGSVFYNHKVRWRDGEWINPIDWCRWSGYTAGNHLAS